MSSQPAPLKVCVLITYIGPWPRLFPLFLESCARNPGVDFIFFSDQERPDIAPGNTTFISTTLAELRERFSDILGYRVALEAPYKLCDFKTTAGLLFADHLIGADYWGHGDIDLVYGDLSPWVDPSFLGQWDVLSGHASWIFGPMTLYRNTDVVNRLFLESPDWMRVAQDPQHLAFDESSYLWNEMRRSSVFEIEFPYENMTLIVQRAAREGRIRAHFETVEVDHIEPGALVRIQPDGRIFDGEREARVMHWGSHVHTGRMRLPNWSTTPASGIAVSRFRPYAAETTESVFFPLVDRFWDYHYRVRRRRFLLRRRLRRAFRR